MYTKFERNRLRTFQDIVGAKNCVSRTTHLTIQVQITRNLKSALFYAYYFATTSNLEKSFYSHVIYTCFRSGLRKKPLFLTQQRPP